MQINDQGGTRKASTPAPQGMHPGRCVFIIDLGTQNDTYQGKPKSNRKLQIGFELVGSVMPTENPGDPAKPFVISREFTASFGSKANLRKTIELWLGRSFTDQEASVGIDMRQLLGKECMLQVVHETKPDQYGQMKTRAKLMAVMPVMQGMPVAQSFNQPMMFEIGAQDQFQVFQKVYGWLRDMIIQSPEFNAECGKHGQNAQHLNQQAKDAWKAQNPLQGQQQQSAMQPNQQWMQQGPPAGYGNQQQQQYQQPMQTGFNQNQQQQANTGFNQQQNQQPSQNQPQPQGPPPGYSQHPQYPNTPQQGFGGQQQNQRSMTPPPAQQQGFGGQQQNQQQGGFGQGYNPNVVGGFSTTTNSDDPF